MTHYDVLGVPFDATTDQIRNAYWAQIQFYHPDVFTGDDSVAETKAKQLNESYAVLSNPNLRAEYDKRLCSKTQEPQEVECKRVVYSSTPTAKSTKSTLQLINRIFSICLLTSVIVAVFIFASRRWGLKQPEETTCSVDKGIRFTRTSGYEYTLYPVADGNLNLEPLSLEEMLKD